MSSVRTNRYEVGVDSEGKNNLTSLKVKEFTISEIEVWEVIGAEPISTQKQKFLEWLKELVK